MPVNRRKKDLIVREGEYRGRRLVELGLSGSWKQSAGGAGAAREDRDARLPPPSEICERRLRRSQVGIWMVRVNARGRKAKGPTAK